MDIGKCMARALWHSDKFLRDLTCWVFPRGKDGKNHMRNQTKKFTTDRGSTHCFQKISSVKTCVWSWTKQEPEIMQRRDWQNVRDKVQTKLKKQFYRTEHKQLYLEKFIDTLLRNILKRACYCETYKHTKYISTVFQIQLAAFNLKVCWIILQGVVLHCHPPEEK